MLRWARACVQQRLRGALPCQASGPRRAALHRQTPMSRASFLDPVPHCLQDINELKSSVEKAKNDTVGWEGGRGGPAQPLHVCMHACVHARASRWVSGWVGGCMCGRGCIQGGEEG